MAANGGEPTRRRLLAPLLMLLLLTLLGFWLRTHNLDAFSFWTDEGLTPERSGYPIAQIPVSYTHLTLPTSDLV